MICIYLDPIRNVNIQRHPLLQSFFPGNGGDQ
jgi:hypothetical protein